MTKPEIRQEYMIERIKEDEHESCTPEDCDTSSGPHPLRLPLGELGV